MNQLGFISNPTELCKQNLINKNYIVSCVEGIQIWQNSNNNTITENTITNCQYTAIGFQYSNDKRGKLEITYHIQDSEHPYTLLTRNIISNNNYVNNTSQFGASEWYYLTWGGNRSINTLYKNYWSDYNGTDTNDDGIGDTPYVVDEYNQDNHTINGTYNIFLS